VGRIAIIQGHPDPAGAVETCGSAQRHKRLEKPAAPGREGK
jgi:hypothetical protein